MLQIGLSILTFITNILYLFINYFYDVLFLLVVELCKYCMQLKRWLKVVCFFFYLGLDKHLTKYYQTKVMFFFSNKKDEVHSLLI